MNKRVWKELHFTSYDEYNRWGAVFQSNRRAFLPGLYWSMEDGPMVIVTNAGCGDLRRLARLDGLRVPDYMQLPDDDPVVIELTAKH